MADQITSENTKKILLEGKGGEIKEKPRQEYLRKKKQADVIVENATEKRYLWTARAFSVIFSISLCCNFILTYVITVTWPLYRVEPYLFSFQDKNEQIYHVEPIDRIKDYKFLTELFVREYIQLRNSFIADYDEMEKRWGKNGKLREMSSDRTYKEFQQKFAKATLEKIRKNSIRRDITFKSVTEVGGKDNQTWWEIEFVASDMAPTKEMPDTTTWSAKILVQYRPKQVRFNERLKNPLGFTVLDYKGTRKRND